MGSRSKALPSTPPCWRQTSPKARHRRTSFSGTQTWHLYDAVVIVPKFCNACFVWKPWIGIETSADSGDRLHCQIRLSEIQVTPVLILVLVSYQSRRKPWSKTVKGRCTCKPSASSWYCISKWVRINGSWPRCIRTGSCFMTLSLLAKLFALHSGIKNLLCYFVF